MKLIWWITAGLSVALAADPVALKVRTREQKTEGGTWTEKHETRPLSPAKTAIIVCDMWDRHWCQGANVRVGKLVPRMNALLDAARRHKMMVIHAPSETMDFYKEHPSRLAMLDIPAAQSTPQELPLKDPPLPVDSSDGGCDTPEKFYKAWTRQHPGLKIEPTDFVSDNGAHIYNLLKLRGVDTLVVMGVHTNMCILNRSFAIRQMSKWGMKCLLVRDLTDSMYDPNDKPFVSHERGTELIVEHIEKYWAPSLTSADLSRALGQAR